MNTAEMWLAVQKDGGTYCSKDIDAFYSQEFGLVEINNINDKIDLRDFSSFEDLMRSEWKNVLDFTETLDFKDFESVYNNLTEQRKSRLYSRKLNDWRSLVGKIAEYCKKYGGITFESFDSKIYFTADDFDSCVIGLFKRKRVTKQV